MRIIITIIIIIIIIKKKKRARLSIAQVLRAAGAVIKTATNLKNGQCGGPIAVIAAGLLRLLRRADRGAADRLRLLDLLRIIAVRRAYRGYCGGLIAVILAS